MVHPFAGFLRSLWFQAVFIDTEGSFVPQRYLQAVRRVVLYLQRLDYRQVSGFDEALLSFCSSPSWKHLQ